MFKKFNVVIPLAVADEVRSPFTDKDLKRYESQARQHVAELSKNGVTAGSIAINNRCNLKCTHCYIFEPERRTGNLSEHYRAVPHNTFNRETAGAIAQDFRNARTYFLTIPTMEPLLTDESRIGSLDAAKYFITDEDIESDKKRGMTIITNATLTHKLSDFQVSELAKRVKFLSVSLEGGQALHDSIRGEGNFEKAVRGIRDLTTRGYNSDMICLQATVQPHIEKVYEQARDILDLTGNIPTGRASFTACIEPHLTFIPERADVKYHETVFGEILRACNDAEKEGLDGKLITIYSTYESPAAVVALNNLIKSSGARKEDLELNAFETSYYLRHPEFNKLDVRLEVAPHPVEIPSYPRVAASRDMSNRINLVDADYFQGARMASCFAYQTDEAPWAHWMPGLIPYLDSELLRRGPELAQNLPVPSQSEELSVDPNVSRTRDQYFGEILIKGMQRQIRRAAFLAATYQKLTGVDEHYGK